MSREKNPDSPPAKKRAPRRAAAAPAAATATATGVNQPHFVDPQQRTLLIAQAAYYRAMNRGFAPGHEVADWLAAEAEVDAELLRGTAGS